MLAVHAAPFDYATLPFVNIAELFAAMPVPVPRILGDAGDLGVLALEDLGDVTLQAHSGRPPAASMRRCTAGGRRSSRSFQRRGRELASPGYVPYGIAFDVEKLTWEMDFFIKHFLEALPRRDRCSRPERATRCAPSSRAIVDELAAEPRVLCHRDYHSRNLMWRDGRLSSSTSRTRGWARTPTISSSLLRDSYVDLPERGRRRAHRPTSWRFSGRSSEAVDAFRRRFDLMALQRNLKALGTFGYQTTARGNPGVHPVHPADAAVRPREPARVPALRAVCARASGASTSSSSMTMTLCASASRRICFTASGSTQRHLEHDGLARLRPGRDVRDADAFRLSRSRAPMAEMRRLARREPASTAVEHARADLRRLRRRRLGPRLLERDD